MATLFGNFPNSFAISFRNEDGKPVTPPFDWTLTLVVEVQKSPHYSDMKAAHADEQIVALLSELADQKRRRA